MAHRSTGPFQLLRRLLRQTPVGLLWMGLLISLVIVGTRLPGWQSVSVFGVEPFGALLGDDHPPAPPPAGSGAMPSTPAEMRQEIASLRMRNAHLEQQLQAALQLTTPWEPFPALLGAIPATIIVHRDSSTWRHSFLIDRGTDHGVTLGSAVVHGRTLLGRVMAVSAGASRVQRITDPAWPGVAAVILPAGGFVTVDADEATATNPTQPRLPRGMMQPTGDASLAMLMRFVDLAEDVEAGDLVATSSQAGETPAGLIIGRVHSVDRDSQASFCRIVVTPWGDPTALENVQVLPRHAGSLPANLAQ